MLQRIYLEKSRNVRSLITVLSAYFVLLGWFDAAENLS